MGCDIHLYVEKRVNGKWQSADKWTPDPYAEENEHARHTEIAIIDEDKPLVMHVDYDDNYFTSRNYSLFAILADVRNFENGFKPIAPPKGFPTDASKILSDYAADAIDHTPSYFTVAELMAFDWTQIVTMTGVVDLPTYYDWTCYAKDQGDCPKSWCGAIFSNNIRMVSQTELDQILKEFLENSSSDEKHELRKISGGFFGANSENPKIKPLTKIYSQITWQQAYYKRCSEFLSELLPKLWRLGKPEDVRIVFWFDN